MTIAKVKEQDGMTLAKVKEQDGMTVQYSCKVRHAQVSHAPYRKCQVCPTSAACHGCNAPVTEQGCMGRAL